MEANRIETSSLSVDYCESDDGDIWIEIFDDETALSPLKVRTSDAAQLAPILAHFAEHGTLPEKETK